MKNWKTTTAGFVVAFLQVYSGGLNWKSIATAAALATLGMVSKDKDVTGAGPDAHRVSTPADPVPES